MKINYIEREGEKLRGNTTHFTERRKTVWNIIEQQMKNNEEAPFDEG